MITMAIQAGTGPRSDRASCVWNGRSFEAQAFSCTTALARMLVEAGCPDQPWETWTANGKRSLHGTSLHAHAKRMLVEVNGRLRWRPYSAPAHFPARSEG